MTGSMERSASAVADLAAVDATHAAGFTDGEGREVVVEDEALLVLATGVVVEALFFIGRSQRGDGERLGFAAGENGGAVDAWQGADFAVKRAEIADAAAVGAHAFVHDGNAERLLLEVFEGLLDIEVGGFRSALLDGGFHFVAEGRLFGALGFGRRVNGGFDAVAGDFVGDFEQVFLGENEHQTRAFPCRRV
jgi:hypothetical protein